MKIKLAQAAIRLGIHKQTMWSYIRQGKIPATKTNTNRWFADTIDIDKLIGEASYIEEQGVALYARVSSSENKADLERQAVRLMAFANARGWRVVRVEKEIASGVNDQRPKIIIITQGCI